MSKKEPITPRSDALLDKALEHAVGDMPFDDAMRLCQDLEEKLEMAKFWMAKVNDYDPPRMQDLSRMAQCLQFISREPQSDTNNEQQH